MEKYQFYEQEKPNFDRLQNYFPWLNLDNNQRCDEEINDNYVKSERFLKKVMF